MYEVGIFSSKKLVGGSADDEETRDVGLHGVRGVRGEHTVRGDAGRSSDVVSGCLECLFVFGLLCLGLVELGVIRRRHAELLGWCVLLFAVFVCCLVICVWVGWVGLGVLRPRAAGRHLGAGLGPRAHRLGK